MYPGIELRLLRYAVAVAETLSSSQAAERLNTSQPSLSRQIQKLEHDLEVKLFDRTKRWVELTPAGRAFVQEARKAIAHAERAEAMAKQLSSEPSVTHAVGYCACLDLKFISAIKRTRTPSQVQFAFRSAPYQELVRELLRHECEAAIMVLPVEENDLITQALFSEPLAVALPASHVLARKSDIHIHDLADAQMILPSKCFGPAVCELLLSPFKAAAVHLTVNDEPAGRLEALHLVADGFGVTIGQPSVLATAKEGVILRPVSEPNMSKEATAQLAKYDKEIAEQVKGIREVTEFDLGLGRFSAFFDGPAQLEVGESIESVNSLRVDEIDSAVWRDKDKADSRILFRLRCSADVVTSMSPTVPFFSPTKYAVGGEKQQYSSFLNLVASPRKQERERTFPVTLYGEATLQNTNGDWKLISIKVDTSHPSSEEMARLSLVPRKE